MINRREFILGLVALAATLQLPKIYRFIITDPRTELRSGWILTKSDR